MNNCYDTEIVDVILVNDNCYLSYKLYLFIKVRAIFGVYPWSGVGIGRDSLRDHSRKCVLFIALCTSRLPKCMGRGILAKVSPGAWKVDDICRSLGADRGSCSWHVAK